MEKLLNIRNNTILLTLLFGICGFICLLFFNMVYAFSFLFGALISLFYLWHLSFSVSKLSAEKKNINSIIRLAISISFMILIGHILSLNFIVICLGFLCNHLALLIQVSLQIVKDKVGRSCK